MAVQGRRNSRLAQEGDYGVSDEGRLMVWPPGGPREIGVNHGNYSGPPMWWLEHEDQTISIFQTFMPRWGEFAGNHIVLMRGVWMTTTESIGQPDEHGIFPAMQVTP